MLFSKTKKEVMEMTVPEFAHAHKDLLVIVCDPSDDTIFVGYKDQMVSGKIKSATGKTTHIIRDILSHSQFKGAIDEFIVSLMEVLKLPLKMGSQLYQFLDGALFNISKALRKDNPRPGAVRSPYVAHEGSVKK